MKGPIIALLLLAGCEAYTGDPYLYGLHVTNRSSVAWADISLPENKLALRETIELAAEYWQISPWVLSGWKLVIKDDLSHCLGTATNIGCVTYYNLTITISVAHPAGYAFACAAQTAFVHEFGHLKFIAGDPYHWSPGWWDTNRQKSFWDRTKTMPGCDPYWEYSDQWSGG